MNSMDGGPIFLHKPAMSENCDSPQTVVQSSSSGQDCPSCLDHLKLIRKQFSRIELLENEISILRCERDALMFENEKLQFEKQVVTEALNSHNRQSDQLPSTPQANTHVAIVTNGISLPMTNKKLINNISNGPIGAHPEKLAPQEMVSSNSSFSSTSSTSFATSHDSSASSIGSSIVIPPTVSSPGMNVNQLNGSNMPPGPRGSIHSNSSLTSSSSSNSSSVSMEVSSPLVQNSSDPKSNSNSDKLNSSRELISKNQPVINNNNNKHHYHRSTNPQVVGQQSQARLHSSRHQSSSCSQERKEEGCRRVAGDKQHVQHLIQSSNTLLSASQSSPSLNLINNGKNQTQLSTSTNNFNVMKAEQFEMIRKRQYRVGLNLFNKNPPERGIQFLIQNNFIDVNGPNNRSKSSTISLNNNGSSSSSLMKDSLVDVDETIESLAIGVAHFLITRKGLSKQSIGDYIGNLQNPFNQRVLHYFVNEIDLIGLPVDVALRKFQTYFRFPGEAQKIDKILEVFSHRFLECNSSLPTTSVIPAGARSGGHPTTAGDHVHRVHNNNNQHRIVQRRSTHQSSSGLPEDWSMINQMGMEEDEEDEDYDEEDEDDDGNNDGLKSKKRRMMSQNEVHILAFAIIMLNSDLHTPNNKNRMTCEQFIKNYKGAFEVGCDVSDEYLSQIHERIRVNELKTGPDHVSQVMKVQQQLVPGNTKQTSVVPKLAIPSRRLVCFCRLYEVYDVNKKDRAGQHQREVFLFNDMLLVTKIYKKDSSTTSIMSGNNMIPTSTGLAGGQPTAPRQSQQVTCQYSFRGSYSLSNVAVLLFEAPYYHFGIRIVKRNPGESKSAQKTLITFNARNEHDRSRFVDDLREAIEEMALMDSIKMNGFTSDPLIFGVKSSTGSLNTAIGSNHKSGSIISSSTTSCDLRSSGSSTKSTGSLISSGSNGSNDSTSSGTMKPVKVTNDGSKAVSADQNMSKSSSLLDFGVNHVKSNSSTSTTSSNASSGLGSDKL